MNLPINYIEISEFEQQSNIFSLTKEYLTKWLERSYLENPETFQEEYGANLNDFLSNYKFKNEGISFSRSYSHEPPLDYISVSIRIYDSEDDYILEYRAYYDLGLQIFDDKMG